MRTAERWKVHRRTNQRQKGGVASQSREAGKRYLEGEGVIRWISTNCTIFHLDGGSRRHKMSVDSSLFMCFIVRLC